MLLVLMDFEEKFLRKLMALRLMCYLRGFGGIR